MAGKQNMSWRLRLATVRYRFTESLFVQPAALMLVGVVLAIITTRIDDSLSPDTDLPFTLAMSSNAATWLLSTVAGAMITTVGVVFSLTVVSLQLASGQFSPRGARPPGSGHGGFNQEADFRIAGPRSSNTAGARYLHQECRRTVL